MSDVAINKTVSTPGDVTEVPLDSVVTYTIPGAVGHRPWRCLYVHLHDGCAPRDTAPGRSGRRRNRVPGCIRRLQLRQRDLYGREIPCLSARWWYETPGSSVPETSPTLVIWKAFLSEMYADLAKFDFFRHILYNICT
jgi:hypothetical protein